MVRSTVANILGVPISKLNKDDINRVILDVIQANRRGIILNANAHCLNIAYTSPWLRDFLNTVEAVHCDGYGVVFAARFLNGTKLHRVTYAKYIWELAAFAETHQLSMFFLGAKPQVADQAVTAITKKHPKLKIAGTHHGYFHKDAHHPDNQTVLELIRSASPDILLVGFGMPLQERWLMDNWDKLDVPVALAVGAGFDYASGNLSRAPQWMTNNGLEWLGRLIIEPKRLWRRYLLGNPLFMYRVFKQKFGLDHFIKQ